MKHTPTKPQRLQNFLYSGAGEMILKGPVSEEVLRGKRTGICPSGGGGEHKTDKDFCLWLERRQTWPIGNWHFIKVKRGNCMLG